MVRDGVLLCSSNVVLPEICYETLETNDLVPYDLKLKGPSTILSTIWIVLGVALFFVNRLSSLSLRYNLIGGALLLFSFVADKLTQKSIRLRMFESQEIRTSRRNLTRRSRVIRGSFLIAAFVWIGIVFIGIRLSADIMGVVWILLVMGASLGPDVLLKGQKMPQFVVTESDVGMFVIAGPSHQYLTALASHTGDSWDRLASGQHEGGGTHVGE